MSPIVNALLGVLFLAVGAVATLVMYYLRGSTTRGKPTNAKPPAAAGKAKTKEPTEYLAQWRRSSDELEGNMAFIHAVAATGRTVIEPMRTRKKTYSWDDLLFKGAQLAKTPLNEEETVLTETIIGPAARQPLVINTPIYVSHMSFGALSREVKIALAKGSAAVKTAMCSGEGGILKEERCAAHRFIFEYVPNQYSVTEENLCDVDAIEIKIGQSAKPGMGGHLPGNKVTPEIAAVRGRTAGVDIISPAVRRPTHSRRFETQGRLAARAVRRQANRNQDCGRKY